MKTKKIGMLGMGTALGLGVFACVSPTDTPESAAANQEENRAELQEVPRRAFTCTCNVPPPRPSVEPVFRPFRPSPSQHAPSKPQAGSGQRFGTIPVHMADIDGDGRLDLSTHMQVGPAATRYDNISFAQIPGLFESLGKQYYNWHGVASVDTDHDGQKEIFMAPYDSPHGLMYFKKEGSTFQSVPLDVRIKTATGAWLPGTTNLGDYTKGWSSETIAIADLDGNGFADIYIPFYHVHSVNRAILLMNYGPKGSNGQFVEEALFRGIEGPHTRDPKPEGVQFADIDGDGDVDLVTSMRVYVNVGNGFFDDQTDAHGLANAFHGKDKDEGLTFVDYDMDGQLDLFLHGPSTDRLLWRGNKGSNGQILFENQTNPSGLTALLRGKHWYWGDAWGDFDLDGDMDLLFQSTKSEDGKGSDRAPAAFLVNQGDGTFRLSPNTLPTADGVAVGDVDGDGRLDLYFSTSQGELYMNETPRLPGSQVLAISPRDEQGLDNQYGSAVTLRDTCVLPGHTTPSYRAQMVAGANGVYLALNQYAPQVGVTEGHCYEIDVQFMAGRNGSPHFTSIPYDPKVEGSRRIVVTRDGTLSREPLGN